MPSSPRLASAHRARELIRLARFGGFGTVSHGQPLVTLVALASDQQGHPIMLLSDLARHTRNITADQRASLLIQESQPDTVDAARLHRDNQAGRGEPADESGDPMTRPRLSLIGKVAPVDSDERPALLERFLARHPDAVRLTQFSDFRLYRLDVEAAHLVAGFGAVHDLPAARLLIAAETAAPMASAEASIRDHMNTDHQPALQAMAVTLAGLPPGRWQMTGIDCEGFDLFDSNHGWARLRFAQPLRNPAGARALFKSMAEQARSGQPENPDHGGRHADEPDTC